MKSSEPCSSAVVLPEENYFNYHCAGMGYAHTNQLLQMMKWNNDGLIIIYDPDAAFRDVFSDSLIVSPSCEYTGEQK